MVRLAWLGITFVLSLVLCACEPPHFQWPEKVPALKTPTGGMRFPYDEFKTWRNTQAEKGFMAGAAIVDLTPKAPRTMYMAGYSPNKIAMGVSDPITARILFMDDGEQSLLMISGDFVGLQRDTVQAIRSRITQTYPDEILIAATHNHAGPDTMGLWGPRFLFMIPTASGRDPAYMARIEREIARGVSQAISSARPAKLRAARVTIPDGISENAHKPGYKDDEAVLLQALSLRGQVIFTAMNYTNHAEALGGNWPKFSADFPAFFYDRLQARQGGVAAFFQGSCGLIIVPALPHRTETTLHVRRLGAVRIGQTLGDYAAMAIEQGEWITQPRIERKHIEFAIPVENQMFLDLGKQGLIGGTFQGTDVLTEMMSVQLGPLQIVTVPGEVSTTIGLAIKKRMPGPYRMVIGLGNDELGYIMTPQEWGEEMFEYERTVSVGSQAGPLVLDHARKLLTDTARR